MKKLGFDINADKLPDSRFKDFLKRCDELAYTDSVPGVVVNGLPIPLSFSFGRVGISFSGGADSTLLLYLLCRIISEFKLSTKVYLISVVRNWETTEHMEKARGEIADYLDKMFPGIIVKTSEGFLPSALEQTPAKNLMMSPYEKQFFKNEGELKNSDVFYHQMFNHCKASRHKLNAIYVGTTTNPPRDSKTTPGPAFRHHENSSLQNFNIVKYPISYAGAQYYHFEPFEYIEKSWVMAQYKNFAIEELLALTKSCEFNEQGCGMCFHCDERRWGIENSEMFLAENQAKGSEKSFLGIRF